MKLNLGLLFVAAQAAGVLSARGPHPLGSPREYKANLARQEAQACWYESGFGCADGYCWTACGDNGEWCWTAANGGSGDWESCNTFSDCIGSGDCATGDCKECGCSC